MVYLSFLFLYLPNTHKIWYNPIIEIMVSEVDMGRIIGRGGKMAKAIRTLVQATAFNKGIKRVKINIDSF